jgi:hypothetical protein
MALNSWFESAVVVHSPDVAADGGNCVVRAASGVPLPPLLLQPLLLYVGSWGGLQLLRQAESYTPVARLASSGRWTRYSRPLTLVEFAPLGHVVVVVAAVVQVTDYAENPYRTTSLMTLRKWWESQSLLLTISTDRSKQQLCYLDPALSYLTVLLYRPQSSSYMNCLSFFLFPLWIGEWLCEDIPTM